ncbi:hypothetical protein [Tepidibacillus fermentans]|uniref:Uncharacterized protein n=1 Tax=Tepidibacillus fermentans TaxID=1281767 RepID=A0A4R3KBZ8_9BACI|nr:hypothetical protein [Tepidibacillus fermentans]TCS80608.1 hypothetical protein EDD72_11628 [Tepidibacillus fermentans]
MPTYLGWLYDTAFLWILIGGSLLAIGYAYYKDEEIEDKKQRRKQ